MDNENVIRPKHYKVGGMDTIKILKTKMTPEEYKGFLKGNIMKYLTRADYKNGIEDYEKAQYYMNELVKTVKENNK